MPHPVVHFEIAGPDGEALTGFYHDLFGWEAQSAGPGYWIVPPQGGGIGGGVMQTPPGVPSYLTVYVETDDLQATIDRGVELGAEVLVGPTPIAGVGSFAMLRDPAGNAISLLKSDQVGGPGAADLLARD